LYNSTMASFKTAKASLSVLLAVLLIQQGRILEAQDTSGPTVVEDKYLQVTCPKYLPDADTTTILPSMNAEITPLMVTIEDLKSSVIEQLNAIHPGVPIREDLLDEAFPTVLSVKFNDCVESVAMEENAFGRYSTNITKFNNKCGTIEDYNRQLTQDNQDRYTLQNNIEFQLEFESSEVMSKGQIVTNFVANYTFVYRAAVLCEYIVDYVVDTSATTILDRTLVFDTMSKMGNFTVDLDIFKTEEFKTPVSACTKPGVVDGSTADIPCYSAGETVFISGKLRQSEILPDTKNMIEALDLHLQGFHCWATTTVDMCSKPHFSIIEDGCPVLASQGQKMVTENGAGGKYMNMSVPVFFVKADETKGETPSNRVWLTCDFEVCQGECKPDCTGEMEEEGEGLNYVCDEGLQNPHSGKFSHTFRKRRSLQQERQHVVKQIGPLVKRKRYIQLLSDDTKARPTVYFKQISVFEKTQKDTNRMPILTGVAHRTPIQFQDPGVSLMIIVVSCMAVFLLSLAAIVAAFVYWRRGIRDSCQRWTRFRQYAFTSDVFLCFNSFALYISVRLVRLL